MTEQHFDPEVVALLNEIVSDPAAGLLRVPKRPLRNWIASPEELVTPHASYLTKAEKHLVDTYREQAAWLLLDAAAEATRRKLLVFTSLGKVPAQRRVEAKALQVRLDAEDASHLDHILANHGVGSDLVRGALSLYPTDFARLWLALAFIAEAMPSAAGHTLASLINSRTGFVVKAQAFEAHAHLLSQAGDFHAALECSEQALATNDEEARLLVWCLTTSIQGSQAARARDYARRIDSIERPEFFSQISGALADERRAGIWEPSQHARGAVAAIMDAAEDQSREILGVFA